MKFSMKSIAAAALMSVATPAFAGGVTVAENGDSKLKLEGVFFTSVLSEKTKANALTTNKTMGVAVDRAYFTAKYFFDKNWYARITTDVQFESGTAAATKRDNNIFLKAAYLEGKLAGDALALRIGQSHNPWIDYEQGLWKHRYAAKVAADYYGFDSSFDLGVGLKGKLADGLVKYFVTATNGAGYGSGNAKFNALDLNGRIGIYPVEGLTIDIQARDGHKGTKTLGVAGTKSTFTQAMITYGATKNYRVGVNYLNNKAQNKVTATTTTASGFGIWAWAKFGGNMGVFARMEKIKTRKDGVAQNITTDHTLIGLEYAPINNITFALVADQDKDKSAAHVLGNTVTITKLGLFTEFKF